MSQSILYHHIATYSTGVAVNYSKLDLALLHCSLPELSSVTLSDHQCAHNQTFCSAIRSRKRLMVMSFEATDRMTPLQYVGSVT